MTPALRLPPGLAPNRDGLDVVMMVCTAGHVDHGKTRLVKMLTGCRTDRLKAEQERSMTIDLGFAPCSLGGDLLVGIVDVPGHERFIRNMVAGVSGIGLALLVVAADDGVMPQTVEHVRILELLGVRHGVVALTKTDLVDASTLERRLAEVREFLGGTFLRGAPVCPVSSETFEGYPAFYDTLVAAIRRETSRARAGIFRMPVERTFSLPGRGQVLTGIPLAGSVAAGDLLELLPGGATGRVRSIQRFGRDAASGQSGQCLALNVPDLGKVPVVRGQVLAVPGYLRPARFFHLRLRTVPELARPLRTGEFVQWHAGTREAAGRIFLLDRRELGASQETLATVALDEPAVAAPHDRFILRLASPPATVAGGEVLAVETAAKRPRRAHALERLRTYEEALAGVDPDGEDGCARRLLYALQWRHRLGAPPQALAREILVEEPRAQAAVERLASAGKVRLLAGDYAVTPESLAELQRGVEERIAQAKASGARHVASADLRGGALWPAPVWHAVMEAVLARGFALRRGDAWALPGADAALPEADRALAERIAAFYRDAGFEPPRASEAAARLQAEPAAVERLARHLCETGTLVRIDQNVLFHRDAYRRAQDLALAMARERGLLDTNAFKTALGASRKYALAFLEHLDLRRVTIRRADGRILAPDHAERLL